MRSMTGKSAAESLLGPNEVLLTDSLVSSEERSRLWQWAEDQYRSGKLLNTPSDPGGFSTPFHSVEGSLTRLTSAAARRDNASEQRLIWVPDVDEECLDPLPAELWEIRARVVDLLGLSGLEEDHYKGTFLSCTSPGTGVHAHCDAKLIIRGEERPIFRCNLLFKRPEEGGLPVLESREIDVPDGGMWASFPTELLHAASPVRGTQIRGLLSFGFLVRLAEFWQRRFRLSMDFAVEYGLDSGDEPRRALLEQLRAAPEAQGIGQARIDLLEFILSSTGGFSIQAAADSLQQTPAETWEALRDLQRSPPVESWSSLSAERGRVLVL